VGGICHEHERQNEDPVVVLKPRLAHSYREIYCLNQRGALNDGGDCCNGSNPERCLFFSWQSSTAARRQAEEGAEREGAKCDCQEGFAERDSHCCAAN
jgi:hypothetical protein